jgi:AraC-like DNA-binding protein
LKQEEVARAARLSPSCFSQAFREEMGVTYASYLRDLRLEEARRLLRGTSYSLPEIAQEVGYQTPSALHRAFKKAVGMAPGQYRQQFARPGSP